MRASRTALVACLMAGLLGCSSKRASVTGTVSYNGQPVKAGVVYFIYEEGGQYQAELKDGAYQFMDVPTGNVKVLVNNEMFNPEQRPQSYTARGQQLSRGYNRGMQEYDRLMGRGGADKKEEAAGTPLSKEKKEELAKVFVKIPKKYAGEKTTTLTYTVGPGRQTKDFALTD